MRTKEELLDIVKEIDSGKGIVTDKKDVEYLSDVKAALKWVLNNIATGHEVSKIEKETRKITDSWFNKFRTYAFDCR